MRIVVATPCTLWTGAVGGDGYGSLRIGDRIHKAHRVAYERHYGPIPTDLTVDHLCFTPLCVNPQHLRLLTRAENSRNQRSAYKQHCVNGHEYTPANTYVRTGAAKGRRDCRACIRERGRRSRERAA